MRNWLFVFKKLKKRDLLIFYDREINMAMIEVEHLQKNFVKTVKEPGLKGALRSFIHPEKQTFEAVKDLTLEVPKGQRSRPPLKC